MTYKLLARQFRFDRYINGTLMAEGICIDKASSLDDAVSVAARIASRGPKGETPVLVYRSPISSQANDEIVAMICDELDNIYVRDGFCDWADVAAARDEIVRRISRTPSPQTGEPSTRDAVIEECAKVADSRTVGNDDEYDYHDIGAVVCAKYIAAAIRQLKGRDRP